ncbi:FMN-dependent alpha-hydroxy acid dehydrogenase [Aspergillus foveolatus]|uniref:FMN-dependent alpha-hydroxy acid dehydrogenase n=1 Tax=Aspergillus foveolatus TaxID=210207 RepID=UPI003CCCB8A7
MYTRKDVAHHNARHSCWVIVNNHVYDVTKFLDAHPGGASAILLYAGKDATAVFEATHPAGTLGQLPHEYHLGPVAPVTRDAESSPASNENKVGSQSSRPPAPAPAPHLHTVQNLNEFESIAKACLSPNAWAYYSSAADSLASLHKNLTDWSKITLRPRILRNVSRVSLSRTVMGHRNSLPVFIAPTARAKLGHPDGEVCLARAAARHNILYAVSSYASVGHAELAEELAKEKTRLVPASARSGQGALAFQLYLPHDKERGGRALIAKAKDSGYQALVITVDTPVVGKREADERFQAELEVSSSERAGVQVGVPRKAEPGGDAPVLRGFHSSTLDWDDIPWIREVWGPQPLIIKGIQTVEDALRASEAGIDGIYLSNHGGRQLDYAPSSIQTLLEINCFCPEVLKRVEVYLDGAVRRGTDVIKAICLGATGVGLGRPLLYALSGYGTDGVDKALQMLSDEIETSLRLMGVVDVSELDLSFVNTTALEKDLVSARNLDGRFKARHKL